MPEPYPEVAVADRAVRRRSLRRFLHRYTAVLKNKVAHLREMSGHEWELSEVCNQLFCFSALVKRRKVQCQPTKRNNREEDEREDLLRSPKKAQFLGRLLLR
jgi:hypothetical protein